MKSQGLWVLIGSTGKTSWDGISGLKFEPHSQQGLVYTYMILRNYF